MNDELAKILTKHLLNMSSRPTCLLIILFMLMHNHYCIWKNLIGHMTVNADPSEKLISCAQCITDFQRLIYIWG